MINATRVRQRSRASSSNISKDYKDDEDCKLKLKAQPAQCGWRVESAAEGLVVQAGGAAKDMPLIRVSTAPEALHDECLL